MIDVRVKLDVADLKRQFAGLEKATTAAMVRSLNKTAVSVRAEAVKLIRGRRALKAKTIREAIAIRKATKALLIAEVIVSGRPIPLREYAARQTKRGVTVNVVGRRQLVKPDGIPTFQIARFGNHVYVREGKKRLPIRKLYGPSLPSALGQQAIEAALVRIATTTFRKRFREEMAFELRRARK
jgi:hypothetical protein